MEKCFGGGRELGRGFLLHLFHVAVVVVLVVVVDPTSSTEPLCTLSLPKRVPLPLPSPPLLPPPSASLLKQTLWTACMTFQLCGWHSLLQRLQQYTGLLKHNSERNLDPSSIFRYTSSPRSSGVRVCECVCVSVSALHYP